VSIDCTEAVSANLLSVKELEEFFSKALGGRKPSRTSRAVASNEPQQPEPPDIIRCGAQAPRSVGGLYTPRTSNASTPRKVTTGGSATSTPRRPASARGKNRKKEKNELTRKEEVVAETWHFNIKGHRIVAGVPSTANNGQGQWLLESMLRRYLQRMSLLSRVELHREADGSIKLRVDSKAINRTLDELQRAETEEGSDLHTFEKGRMPWRAPATVHPLQFDTLANLDEEQNELLDLEATTIYVKPRGGQQEQSPPPYEKGTGSAVHPIEPFNGCMGQLPGMAYKTDM